MTQPKDCIGAVVYSSALRAAEALRVNRRWSACMLVELTNLSHDLRIRCRSRSQVEYRVIELRNLVRGSIGHVAAHAYPSICSQDHSTGIRAGHNGGACMWRLLPCHDEAIAKLKSRLPSRSKVEQGATEMAS